MISLKVHSVLDYIAAILIVASPWIFGFENLNYARGIFVYGGIFLVLYSLFTDYKYSVFNWISVPFHMGMDAIIGLVFLISPNIFDYSSELTTMQYAVHWIFGLGIIALVVFTNQQKAAVSGIRSEFKKAA